jgi:DNA-binding NarL/FixJ family response regulator
MHATTLNVPHTVIEVVLVEDNERYLHELSTLLSESQDIKVVGQYNKGRTAIEDIIKKRPDVTLIDMELPDISGIDVITAVSSSGCPTEFLVLTVYEDDAHLFPALQAGALGYIVKGATTLDEVEQAIHDVIDGGAPMSSSIAKRVLETFKKVKPAKKAKFQDLTKRELQILDYVNRGYSTRKVADDLHISYETVRSHLKNIYQKLHVHTAVEALLLYNKD